MKWDIHDTVQAICLGAAFLMIGLCVYYMGAS